MLTPAPDQSTPTSVYLYYDRAGLLIYVGITSRGITRNRQHNATKEWWPFVYSQTVEHYATRAEAAQRERSLIVRNEPPFNIQHNRRAASVKALYLKLQNAPPSALAVLDPDRPKTLMASRIVRHPKDTTLFSVHVDDTTPFLNSALVGVSERKAPVIFNDGHTWGHAIACIPKERSIEIRIRMKRTGMRCAGAVVRFSYEPVVRIKTIKLVDGHFPIERAA